MCVCVCVCAYVGVWLLSPRIHVHVHTHTHTHTNTHTHTQLTKLDLAGCYLADEGAIELSIGIADCAALSVLDLSGNR